MFLDNLSISLLRTCDELKLSYEKAAERCGMSDRHFGSIVRKVSSPSLDYFEKLCDGFCMTPNTILRINEPMVQVSHVRCYYLINGQLSGYPICPGCDVTLEREYLRFCYCCGKRLGWDGYDKAVLILPKDNV